MIAYSSGVSILVVAALTVESSAAERMDMPSENDGGAKRAKPWAGRTTVNTATASVAAKNPQQRLRAAWRTICSPRRDQGSGAGSVRNAWAPHHCKTVRMAAMYFFRQAVTVATGDL